MIRRAGRASTGSRSTAARSSATAAATSRSAMRSGFPAILVPGPDPYDGPEPDFRAETLLEAAEWIVDLGPSTSSG